MPPGNENRREPKKGEAKHTNPSNAKCYKMQIRPRSHRMRSTSQKARRKLNLLLRTEVFIPQQAASKVYAWKFAFKYAFASCVNGASQFHKMQPVLVTKHKTRCREPRTGNMPECETSPDEARTTKRKSRTATNASSNQRLSLRVHLA